MGRSRRIKMGRRKKRGVKEDEIPSHPLLETEKV